MIYAYFATQADFDAAHERVKAALLPPPRVGGVTASAVWEPIQHPTRPDVLVPGALDVPLALLEGVLVLSGLGAQALGWPFEDQSPDMTPLRELRRQDQPSLWALFPSQQFFDAWRFASGLSPVYVAGPFGEVAALGSLDMPVEVCSGLRVHTTAGLVAYGFNLADLEAAEHG